MAEKYSKKPLTEKVMISAHGTYKRALLRGERKEENYLSERENVQNNVEDLVEETKAYLASRPRGISEKEEKSMPFYKIEQAFYKNLKTNKEAYDQEEISWRQLQRSDSKALKEYKLAIDRLKQGIQNRPELEQKAIQHKADTESEALEHRVEKIAAVVLIAIGASIVLSTQATITTYSVLPQNSNQAQFFIMGIILIALGIFFPSMAFFKNLRKNLKKKTSRVTKTKKKKKK
jgi:hypothetical protein